MVGATPSTQVPESLVRMLQADSRFFGGEVHFGTDPNKIVTAEYWIWGEEDGPWQLRVPNVMTLRLREIGKPGLEIFAGGKHTFENLDGFCHIIIRLVMARWVSRRFVEVFVETWTPENASAAGILLFSDVLRVSIGFARIKEKTVFLFENCLVFARQKALELTVVRRVFLSDLLQVRCRLEHPGKGSGILTIYWREHQPPNERKVSGARLFFDNLSMLKIWAAFMAINASTEPAIGKSLYAPISRSYPTWWNPLMFYNRTRVRDVVAQVPITT